MPWLLILIGISFCTATSLILVNKKIMNNYGFECPTFLTSYHFVLSAILLNVMVKLNFIQKDRNVPTIVRWTTGAFGVGSIVFMNLNLKVNSIGFYQLTKLLNIPLMVIYKLVVRHEKTPKETLISLAILLTGMALFTVNDVQFNILGCIVAMAAIGSTSIFQSRSAYMQSQYSITGPQLNTIIAIPEFVICFTCACLFETNGPKSILVHKFQSTELFLIFLTGVFAVYGNIIGFIMIGKTGPIAFQVIGHTKTILIFVFGLMMFPPTQYESPEQKKKKILGLVIAMIGVIMYTYFELKFRDQAKKQQLLRAKEEEDNLEEPLENRGKEGIFQAASNDGNDE